jgi:hypothetical protein|eukprot:2645349-Prymnesium_polylepis.2
MVFIQQVLILTYLCALIIKSCGTSSTEVCRLYGFGNSARGVFIFFVVFALATLLLLVLVYAVRLYYAGL